MDREQLMKEVQDGRFFTCTFIKRTTGEVRKMNCRVGVKKYLSGGSLPFDPEEHNLLVVWDAVKRAYRLIPLEGILSIRCHGKEIITDLGAKGGGQLLTTLGGKGGKEQHEGPLSG